MKSFIISLCILALFIFGMVYSINLLFDFENEMKETVNEVREYVKNDNWEEAQNSTQKLEKEWGRKTRWLSCFIEHEELDNIMTTLASLEEFTKYEEKPELMSELAKLEKLIEHIPHKEKLIPENIF